MNKQSDTRQLVRLSSTFLKCHHEHGSKLTVSRYQINTRRFITVADWVKPCRSGQHSLHFTPRQKALVNPQRSLGDLTHRDTLHQAQLTDRAVTRWRSTFRHASATQHLPVIGTQTPLGALTEKQCTDQRQRNFHFSLSRDWSSLYMIARDNYAHS